MERITETHVAVSIVTMVTVNVGGEKYTTDFDTVHIVDVCMVPAAVYSIRPL